MTKYFYSFIDRFKVVLAIAALVLCGALVAGGAVSFWFLILLGNANEDAGQRANNIIQKYEGYLEEKQQELDRSRDQVTRLTDVIEKRLPLIVAQQDQNTDQLGQLAATVDSVATKTKQAATTASRAASQAGQAARKAREPVGSIRLVPHQRDAPSCFAGRDVYGDPCP